MISPMLRAVFGTMFLFIMTSVGASAVFILPDSRRRGGSDIMMGFSGGVMSAALVWSLLIPAIGLFRETSPLPCFLPVCIGTLGGAVFLALGDRAAEKAAGGRKDGAMLLTAITLHNIPEGMAVALSCFLAAEGEAAGAAALAFGIGIQNIPEGAAVSLPLYSDSCPPQRSFRLGVLSGAVEPVFGMLSVLAANTVAPLMPWLLCFSAGSMMYAVSAELIPRSGGRRGALAYVMGFVIMMALDTALG